MQRFTVQEVAELVAERLGKSNSSGVFDNDATGVVIEDGGRLSPHTPLDSRRCIEVTGPEGIIEEFVITIERF